MSSEQTTRLESAFSPLRTACNDAIKKKYPTFAAGFGEIFLLLEWTDWSV